MMIKAISNPFRSKTIGYFGEHTRKNLGDIAVYKILEQHKIWGKLHNLVDFNRIDWKSFQKAVRKSAFILIGGGTQISVLNKSFFDFLAHSGKPIWTFGTGVGSCGFYERKSVDLSPIVPFLERIEHLTVRGPWSIAELKRYGINNAQVVGDPALGYAQSTYTSVSSTTRRVCVNLTLPTHWDEIQVYTDLFHKFSLFLHELATKRWTIDFVALEPGDTQTINKFLADYNIPCNQLFCIYEDPIEYLRTVASADFVLGVRLHSAVLAACAGVPFLLVNYRPKCYDFASSIQRTDSLIDPQNISFQELVMKKEWILERGNSLRQQILDSVNSYKSIQLKFLDHVSHQG